MMQKIVIPYDTSNGVEFKDGDIIVYNERNRTFYKTTKENLFYEEGKKREQFEKKIEEEIKELEEYKKDMTKRFSEFLVEYKETNKKIIGMVKEFIGGE